ncbi:MAG: hypothetical protein M3036_17015, partial [Bifidobacteriales bacterium]|nr:hypothetical protein [Bifidobacteriales bacterium]
MMERRRRKVNRAAQGLQTSVGQADILAIDSFAGRDNGIEKVLLIPTTAIFPCMLMGTGTAQNIKDRWYCALRQLLPINKQIVHLVFIICFQGRVVLGLRGISNALYISVVGVLVSLTQIATILFDVHFQIEIF